MSTSKVELVTKPQRYSTWPWPRAVLGLWPQSGCFNKLANMSYTT